MKVEILESCNKHLLKYEAEMLHRITKNDRSPIENGIIELYDYMKLGLLLPEPGKRLRQKEAAGMVSTCLKMSLNDYAYRSNVNYINAF